MWLVFVIQTQVSFDLGLFGVFPRNLTGMIGIFSGPLIHGSYMHLVSNTVPLLILGGFLFIFYHRIARGVFLQSYFLTGLLVWLLARKSYHIGASGLIYALAAFLVFYGLFKKDLISILISLAVVVLYGGMIYGVLPLYQGVSWESHLFGALVGIFLAYSYGRRKY